MPYQEWRRERPDEARQPVGDRKVPNPAAVDRKMRAQSMQNAPPPGGAFFTCSQDRKECRTWLRNFLPLNL